MLILIVVKLSLTHIVPLIKQPRHFCKKSYGKTALVGQHSSEILSQEKDLEIEYIGV